VSCRLFYPHDVCGFPARWETDLFTSDGFFADSL